MWSFHIFFSLSYTVLIVSILVYLVPVSHRFAKSAVSRTKSDFYFVVSSDMLSLFYLPTVALLILLSTWSSHAVSVWFGHVVYTSMSYKLALLVGFLFLIVALLFASTTYLSSKEIFDYIIVQFNFLYWLILLFWTNSLFTTIFLIEVLSTLLILLVVSGTFSTTSFYNNSNLSFGHVMQNSIPHSFIQSLLFFFWISLISSINLFFGLILLFTRLHSLDYYLIEHIFSFIVCSGSYTEIASIFTVAFLLLFCLFLKCGLAPFFFWKPTFFKGIALLTVVFYVTFFYFVLFLFFIHFITSYMSSILFAFLWVNFSFVLMGLLVLTVILTESLYVKVFIAISSILNSLLVITALTATHSMQLSFYL
jgi:hypothetical protein